MHGNTVATAATVAIGENGSKIASFSHSAGTAHGAPPQLHFFCGPGEWVPEPCESVSVVGTAVSKSTGAAARPKRSKAGFKVANAVNSVSRSRSQNWGGGGGGGEGNR